MIFNIVYGKPNYATIAVTYPNGGTCTCSDGTTTLTAPDTSGSATFSIPHSGQWTVTVTKSGLTGSETVTVDTIGRTYTIALHIQYWLFKEGEGAKVTLTRYEGHNSTAAGSGADVNGHASIGTDSMGISGEIGWYSETQYITASANIRTSGTVDLTQYSTIVVEASKWKGNPSFQRSSTGNSYTGFGGMADGSTRAVKRFDITALTGSYYLRFQAGGSDGGAVYNWYLEA